MVIGVIVMSIIVAGAAFFMANSVPGTTTSIYRTPSSANATMSETVGNVQNMTARLHQSETQTYLRDIPLVGEATAATAGVINSLSILLDIPTIIMTAISETGNNPLMGDISWFTSLLMLIASLVILFAFIKVILRTDV